MQTQTQQTGSSKPAIPEADELYNMLMQEIEPDLVVENLDKLDDLHPNETEEERKARYERYQAAFEEYRVKRQEYMDEKNAEVNEYCKIKIRRIEEKSRQNEADKLAQLEAMFEA